MALDRFDGTMDDLISVIIPVYNVEKYLKACMDSVFAQTHKNLEIILVDDGSRDSSGEMCDQYGRSDARVVVIHKENGGLSDARNCAMNVAKGAWITFLDSDDLLSPDACEAMLSAAIQYEADIVTGGFLRFYDSDMKVEANECHGIKAMKAEELLLKVLYSRMDSYACIRLYRTSIIKSLRFPVGKLYEDMYFVPQAIQRAKQTVLLDQIVYYYRQHGMSIVHRPYTSAKMSMLDSIDVLKTHIVQPSDQVLRALESRRFLMCVKLSGMLFRKKEFQADKKRVAASIKATKWNALLDPDIKLGPRVWAVIAVVCPALLGPAVALRDRIKNRKVK